MSLIIWVKPCPPAYNSHFKPNTEVALFFSSPNISLGLASKTDLGIVYSASDPLYIKIEGLTI